MRRRRPARRDRRMEFLASHETGVLSWMGPDGFPIAVRVPFRADPSSARSRSRPSGGPPHPRGPRVLTVHRHSPTFTWQRNMQVGGPDEIGRGWRLVPRRIVGGFEVPEGRISRFRDFVKKGPGFYRTQAPPSRGDQGAGEETSQLIRRRSERVSSRPPASSRRGKALGPRSTAPPCRCRVVLLHLAMQLVEDPPAYQARRGAPLRFAPEPPVEEELLICDPEVDLGEDLGGPVDQGGAEELAQRHQVVVARHRRDEPLVEVDRLELDPAARVPIEDVLGECSIDSTLKTGTTVARSGMWALAGRRGAGSPSDPQPPSSCSSASQSEPKPG